MWQRRLASPAVDILSFGFLVVEAAKSVSIDECQWQNKFPRDCSKARDLLFSKLTPKDILFFVRTRVNARRICWLLFVYSKSLN